MAERSPRAQALAEKVIGIPELLTCVLEQADQRTLLCSAQRVCHEWRDIIVSTPAIQRRLFLLPAPVPRSRAASETAYPGDDSDAVNGIGEGAEDARLNALLWELFRPMFTPRSASTRRAFSEICFGSSDASASAAKRDKILRPGASWRRMLTQQPPAYRLGIWTERQAGSRPPPIAAQAQLPQPQQIYSVLVFPDGLRMGELYDMCIGTPQDPVLSFRPFWARRARLLQLSPDPDDVHGLGTLDFAERALQALTAPAPPLVVVGQGPDSSPADRPAPADGVMRLYKMSLRRPGMGVAFSASRKAYLKNILQFRFPEEAAPGHESMLPAWGNDVHI